MHLSKLIPVYTRFLVDLVFPSNERFDWSRITPGEFAGTALRARPDRTLVTLPGEALFAYRDPLVREAIHALKYRRVMHAGEVLGEVLADYLREECAYERLFEQHGVCLVPIPLSHERLRERGFNQTERILWYATAHLPRESAELLPNALLRVVNTEHQTRMDARASRAENIRGCFAVADATAIHGRRVILVDDVITTGATMREARGVLLDAGARNVTCIALAH